MKRKYVLVAVGCCWRLIDAGCSKKQLGSEKPGSGGIDE